jgi:hypothetical protein
LCKSIVEGDRARDFYTERIYREVEAYCTLKIGCLQGEI